MPGALIAIGVIYGLVLFLQALVNMGLGAIYFLLICFIVFLGFVIEDKIKDKKHEKDNV